MKQHRLRKQLNQFYRSLKARAPADVKAYSGLEGPDLIWLHDEYLNSKPRIAIIGQQVLGWSSYNYPDFIKNWTVGLFRKQSRNTESLILPTRKTGRISSALHSGNSSTRFGNVRFQPSLRIIGRCFGQTLLNLLEEGGEVSLIRLSQMLKRPFSFKRTFCLLNLRLPNRMFASSLPDRTSTVYSGDTFAD